MRRPEVDYKKVATAAETVKKSGKEPSLTNVREALGIISSLPELSSLLEKWYHNQPEFQRLRKLPLSNNIQIEATKIRDRNLELEKSLSLLRATLESTTDGIMMVNGKGQIVDWNQKFVEMWRIPYHKIEAGNEQISFEYILEQLANPQSVIADVNYLYENPEWEGELPLLYFKDGRVFERFTQPQRVGPEIVGRVYSFRDITQKLMADAELRIRERAIEASTHGVIIIDIAQTNQPVIYVNKAFERITGYLESQAIGQSLPYLLGLKSDQIDYRRLELAISELREETAELESYRFDGELFWCELSVAPVSDHTGEVSYYVGIVNDITQRREMEKQLIQQATHDELTALPNRVLLLDRIEQAIIKARKKNSLSGLLFLDLDSFKLINDSLGHTVGDKLLQAVSNRLLLETSDMDTVARLGGDEFVILLAELRDETEAQELAERILLQIAKPFYIDHRNLKITASIGISYYPKDGFDYETLLKTADLSMYHAKDSGRNTYQTFNQEMKRRIINRMQLENALQDAAKNKEFYLIYQPLLDLKTNFTVGVEALLRWRNPLLGEVSPNDFIPVVEENGLIREIGKWVLEEACKQLLAWHKEGFDQLSVAVNISSRQFRQDKLPAIVAEVLDKTGLNPEFLELELTESLLIEDVDHAVELMRQLKTMGIKLVIDDFGTGYSSLSYLKLFPVDKLKIDRSFIDELASKENDAAIVRAIINLGHSLNLEVLAEGVETKLQKEYLLTNDCDYIQGYYVQSPNNAEALSLFFKNTIT